MVLKVYLHDLVAEAEHDRMPRPHPLLHVDGACRWLMVIVQIV